MVFLAACVRACITYIHWLPTSLYSSYSSLVAASTLIIYHTYLPRLLGIPNFPRHFRTCALSWTQLHWTSEAGSLAQMLLVRSLGLHWRHCVMGGVPRSAVLAPPDQYFGLPPQPTAAVGHIYVARDYELEIWNRKAGRLRDTLACISVQKYHKLWPTLTHIANFVNHLLHILLLGVFMMPITCVREHYLELECVKMALLARITFGALIVCSYFRDQWRESVACWELQNHWKPKING